jgi:hypothetical protein
MKAPPCNHTSTGMPAPAALPDVAHTLRNRQSSDARVPAPIGIGLFGCGHIAPYAVASATPVHGSGLIGARQRKLPVGAAAYLMPFHTRSTPSSTPRTGPESVSTTG